MNEEKVIQYYLSNKNNTAHDLAIKFNMKEITINKMLDRYFKSLTNVRT